MTIYYTDVCSTGSMSIGGRCVKCGLPVIHLAGKHDREDSPVSAGKAGRYKRTDSPVSVGKAGKYKRTDSQHSEASGTSHSERSESPQPSGDDIQPSIQSFLENGEQQLDKLREHVTNLEQLGIFPSSPEHWGDTRTPYGKYVNFTPHSRDSPAIAKDWTKIDSVPDSEDEDNGLEWRETDESDCTWLYYTLQQANESAQPVTDTTYWDLRKSQMQAIMQRNAAKLHINGAMR
jgi:hypothetical protein